jgi:hypothetical protein
MTTRPTTAPAIRTGTTQRLPWVPSSSAPATRRDQATFYLLKELDYENARRFDHPVLTLAKAVCNLRHYHRQDRENTVRLIQEHFNPRAGDTWSPEAIRLTWDLVERFTPSLGLRDEDARVKQRKLVLEGEVVELIAWTLPGGRVAADELLEVFRQWNPDLEVTGNAFTRAVQAVTGLRKLRSNGTDWWVGFHLPTADEIAVRAA